MFGNMIQYIKIDNIHGNCKVVSGSGTLDETNEIYDNDFQFDVTR